MTVPRVVSAIKNRPINVSRATWLVSCLVCVFLVISCGSGPSAVGGEETSGRQSLMIPYEQRVVSIDEQHSMRMVNTAQEIPPAFVPWWSEYLERPLWEPTQALTVDVESLVVGAVKCSPKVLALSMTPEIRKAEIVEAEARFDIRAFLESKFVRTSDPVGNVLTTGGAPRFRDQNWYYSGGIRQKSLLGGQFEAAQRFGYQDNNSLYYVPLPQGTGKLSLSYTQPLLNGAGCAYNESVIVLAEIDAGVATDQFAAELQNHLLEVNKAYWTLYVERAGLLQKRRLLQEAEKILDELEGRKKFDASEGQIESAKAAAGARRASVIRTEAAVHNAEARINLLVNDPQLLMHQGAELIPIQRPYLQYTHANVRDSLIVALNKRPEVNESLQQIRAASLREQIATKDLLPVLDAVLAFYVSGLEGEGRMGQAFVDQFTVGEPGYTAGLQFEVPFGNRAAKARLYKRQLELQQFTLQLKQIVAMVVEEIEVAVRDVDAAFREAQTQYLAMKAADQEIQDLDKRWRLLPSEELVAGIVLLDLLAAQERLTNAEIGFVSAQVGYNLSLANLNRATGVLLQCLPEAQSPDRIQAPKEGIDEPWPMPKSDVEELPSPPPEGSSLELTPITRLPPTSAGTTETNNISGLAQPPVK